MTTTHEVKPEGTYSSVWKLWTQDQYDRWCEGLDELVWAGWNPHAWQSHTRIMIMGQPMVVMTFTWGPWP